MVEWSVGFVFVLTFRRFVIKGRLEGIYAWIFLTVFPYGIGILIMKIVNFYLICK